MGTDFKYALISRPKNSFSLMKTIVDLKECFLNMKGCLFWPHSTQQFPNTFFLISNPIFYPKFALDALYRESDLYICTYKLSQDHVELLNSSIRRRNGNNNNPNALQFKSAIRKVLLRAQITASEYANCMGPFKNDVTGGRREGGSDRSVTNGDKGGGGNWQVVTSPSKILFVLKHFSE